MSHNAGRVCTFPLPDQAVSVVIGKRRDGATYRLRFIMQNGEERIAVLPRRMVCDTIASLVRAVGGSVSSSPASNSRSATISLKQPVE